MKTVTFERHVIDRGLPTQVDRYSASRPGDHSGEFVSAAVAQRLLAACEALIHKTELRTRWPCPDCGRPDANARLRTIAIHQEDGKKTITGCWLCNTDDLREQAHTAIAATREGSPANTEGQP